MLVISTSIERDAHKIGSRLRYAYGATPDYPPANKMPYPLGTRSLIEELFNEIVISDSARPRAAPCHCVTCQPAGARGEYWLEQAVYSFVPLATRSQLLVLLWEFDSFFGVFRRVRMDDGVVFRRRRQGSRRRTFPGPQAGNRCSASS